MVSEFWLEALLPSYSCFVLFFVLQGRGFGGFEGGGGYPRLSEWSQMEAMAILPISYLHDIAVKCLVFLSYTPSNSSALCVLGFSSWALIIHSTNITFLQKEFCLPNFPIQLQFEYSFHVLGDKVRQQFTFCTMYISRVLYKISPHCHIISPHNYFLHA